ncbi:MAG: hypothetical protein KME14_10685 [Tildeniella torsiva UHER 1998/13D]|jgi:hypothetical protein|nr:hypothetical protein [Tildeniella torsiva UHER 1998/13D]
MQQLIIGFDPGNHWTKVCVKTLDGKIEKIVIPSSLATDQNSIVQEESSDSFTLFTDPEKDNSREFFKSWSTNPVYNPFQVIVGDPSGNGKPRYAFPMLVSAIWPYIQNGDCLKVVVSVHDKSAYGQAMKDGLDGVHSVTYTSNDEKQETKTFCISVLNVVYESAGVVLGQDNRPLKSFILDIGGGTVLAIPMNKARLALDSVIELPHSGVKALLGNLTVCNELKSLIRSDAAMAPHYARVMSNEGLMSMLKNKGIATVGKIKLDCREVIAPVVTRWLNSLESELHQSLSASYLNEPGRTLLLSGGGSLVPGVKEWASGLGFKTVSDPQFANALGLHSLAQELSQKVAA